MFITMTKHVFSTALSRCSVLAVCDCVAQHDIFRFSCHDEATTPTRKRRRKQRRRGDDPGPQARAGRLVQPVLVLRAGQMIDARIVEQHDRPALYLARHTLRDLTRRNALPVEGIPTGSTWKRLSCLASWPPLTVFFPPIHSPPLNMPRINSILVKCVHQTHSRNCCRRIAAAVL